MVLSSAGKHPADHWPMEPRDIEFFRNLLNAELTSFAPKPGKTVESMDEDANFPDPMRQSNDGIRPKFDTAYS